MTCAVLEREGAIPVAVPIKEESTSSVVFFQGVELEPGTYTITTTRAKFRSHVHVKQRYEGFNWGADLGGHEHSGRRVNSASDRGSTGIEDSDIFESIIDEATVVTPDLWKLLGEKW